MKITFYFSVIFSLLFFGTADDFSSQNGQYPNTVLPSASSSALVSSVNHSTGRVSVSVPLLTLESSGIRIPVILHYNTSGIRVEDRPTEVGYGWRLAAGGKITRVVRQRPDDLLKTSQIWGKPVLDVAQAFFKPIDNSRYVSYNEIDSEPDLFYYEIPGKSGMFVLDGAGTPHTIPYQPDLTVCVVDGAYFTIRDNTGTLYTFGSSSDSRENTTVTFKNENLRTSDQTETQRYVSTWHLETLTDYYGNTATFWYSPRYGETVTTTTHIATYDRIALQDTKSYEVTTSTVPLFLHNILSGRHSIHFYKLGIPGTVSDISYYVDGMQVTDVHFTYDTFAHERVFLTQLHTFGRSFGGSDRRHLCSFTYNKSSLLPPHDSYDYDSWGYYNGKNNPSHLPVVTPSDISGLSGTIPGADKSPVLSHTQACILTSIVHNTGGKTEYSYGLNRHNDTPVGGLRVEKITHFDETDREVSSTRYEYGHSVVGGLGTLPRHFYLANNTNKPILTLSSRPFYDLFFTSGAHILYGKITEIAPDGSQIAYIYSTPGTSPFNTYANAVCTFWLYINSQRLEDQGAWQPAMVTKPKTSRFWCHGLLLKQTTYDRHGSALEETTYTYRHDHPRLAVIKGYSPCVLKDAGGYDTPFLFEYSWESQPVLLASTTTTSSTAPPVTTRYTYDAARAIPVARSVDTPDKTILTTYRYAHDLSSGSSAIRFLVDQGILAPVETVTRVNGLVTASELTEYGFVPLNGTHARIFLPRKKYYLPLPSPATSLTPADCDANGLLVYDSRYKLSQTIEYESDYGRLQTLRTPEDRISTILYAKDPNGLKIDERIAEVSHATIREVFHESFEYSPASAVHRTDRAKTGREVYTGSSLYVYLEDFFPGRYVLSYWTSTDSGRSWQKHTEDLTISPYDDIPSTTISNPGWLDEVRVHPADARLTTRTYLSGVGVSSETDHNGRTTYREYDAFGRLIRILNNDREVLETYEYRLKNE